MANENLYATVAQLKEVYSKEFLIRISNFNDEDDFTDYDDPVLEKALKDASDIMDGYLMGRYATPVKPAPDYFKPDCMTIAVMKMIERKGFVEGTPDESSYNAGKDLIRMRYQRIAEGKISISLPDDSGQATAVQNVQSSAPTKLFDDETLDKF